MIRLLQFAFLIVLLQACVAPRQYVKDISFQKVTIPFKADTIIVLDQRINKRPMNWDLPQISTKQINFIGDPELTPEQKTILTSLIKQSENINGKPAKITLSILEGSCEIDADWKQASEKTRVSVALEIEDIETNQIQRVQTEAFSDYSTVNALEKTVLQTYNVILKNATYQALTIATTPISN